MPKEKFYLLTWENEDAEGSKDIISSQMFVEAVEPTDFVHPTMLGQKFVLSACEVRQSGESWIFNYGGKHADANKVSGIFRGELKIDLERLVGTGSLKWRDEDVGRYSDIDVKVELIE